MKEADAPLTQWMPGLWRIKLSDNGPVSIVTPRADGDEDLTIAVIAEHLNDGNEVLANAYLIAAAPKLYEQLALLVRWAEDQGESCRFAQNALAATRGESHTTCSGPCLAGLMPGEACEQCGKLCEDSETEL